MSSFCLRQIETRCDDEKFFNIECRRVGEELSVVRQTIAMWDAAALLGGLTNYFPIDNPTQLNLTPLRASYFFFTFLSSLLRTEKNIHSNVWKYATKLFYDKTAKKKLFLWLPLKFKLLWHKRYFQFCPDIFVWGFENVIFPFSPNSQFFDKNLKLLI